MVTEALIRSLALSRITGEESAAGFLRRAAPQVDALLANEGGGGEGGGEGGDEILRAALLGALSDRLGHAFVVGYAAALRALLGPRAPRGGRVAMAASEDRGAHPRAIETRLTEDPARPGQGWLLEGRKSWVSTGLEATHAVVIARLGEDRSHDPPRPVLVAVLLPLDRAGVTLGAMPAPPFAPEVGHASLQLDQVRVEPGDLLAGDGYDAWLKPFRTVEDVHVFAAAVGYLSGVIGRSGGDAAAVRVSQGLVVEGAASIERLQALAGRDPGAAATHLRVEAAIASTRRWVLALEPAWARAEAHERARWERDQALLGVAGRARDARFLAAWRRVAGDGGARTGEPRAREGGPG